MVTLTVMTLIYFLPTFVATNRGHTAGGILILNLLFGWTGIGWLAMMLWALLSPPPYYVLMRPVHLPYSAWRRD